jgi:hypothetical protein
MYATNIAKNKRTLAAVGVVLASKLNIDKVNLQLLICLDSNEKGRSTTSGDDLIRVVARPEDEGKRTLEFFQDSFHQCGECELLVVMSVVNVFGENSDCLGIGLSLKLETALLENKAELCTVGNDTVVDNNEIRVGVGANGMAIDFRWWAVSSPPGMGDGDLGDESLVYVEGRSGDFLAEASNLAYFLEEDDGSWLIAINTKTGGIVASVLLTSETGAENLKNLFATLRTRNQELA